MRRLFILPVSVIALALCSAAASAQTRTFTDAAEGYALELPSPSWGVVRRRDGFNRHTDFAYHGAGDCRLHVHREMVDGGVATVALADEDEQRLRLLPGYVENKREPFAGRLSGTKLTYEYSDGGRLTAARTYYLQADKRTVYVLRFTGARELLATLRGEADSIARSFRTR
jgi:hypothetical protein